MNPPTLIGAPLDSGQRQPGCLMGPAAYRVAGLPGMLAELGAPALDRGDLMLTGHMPECDVPNPALDQLPETLAWTGLIRSAVEAELADDRMPIVLGGDHALALGSVSGAAAGSSVSSSPPLPIAARRMMTPMMIPIMLRGRLNQGLLVRSSPPWPAGSASVV